MTLKTMTGLLTATLISVASQSAHSADTARKQIAPSAHPLAKIIVQVSQVSSTTAAANGFVVGGDGCHVLTNFHVAFGKGKSAAGDLELVTPIATGHRIEIKADLKADGTFGRKLKGRVVEYADFTQDDMFGKSNDMAMIKLDECLGKDYALARFEIPDRTVRVPQTVISTLSLSQIDQNKSALFFEERCVAANKTKISGLFFHSCEANPGMSGSPIFRTDADGGYTIVGMSTGKLVVGTDEARFAIYSSLLTPFVLGVLGSVPLATPR